MCFATAPLLTRRKVDAIRRFPCRNLFLWLHNLLQPGLSRTCGLEPRAEASPDRTALLGRQSGH